MPSMLIRHRQMSLLYSLLTLVTVLWASTAMALPKVFTQEGFVTDVDNRPMTGVHSLTILLYRSTDGGQPFSKKPTIISRLPMDAMQSPWDLSIPSTGPIYGQCLAGYEH